MPIANTNQGAVQASIEGITGTQAQWNEDWERLWDLQGVGAGEWDERMLLWLNGKLGFTYTNLPQAMQAYADSTGAPNFGSIISVAIVPHTFQLQLYPGAANTTDVILRAGSSPSGDTKFPA